MLTVKEQASSGASSGGRLCSATTFSVFHITGLHVCERLGRERERGRERSAKRSLQQNYSPIDGPGGNGKREDTRESERERRKSARVSHEFAQNEPTPPSLPRCTAVLD